MSMILILLRFDHSAIKEDQEAMACGKEKEIGIDPKTQGTDKVVSTRIYFYIHMDRVFINANIYCNTN